MIDRSIIRRQIRNHDAILSLLSDIEIIYFQVLNCFNKPAS